MEKRLSQVYPQKWVQIAILIGFCMILYFLNLGRWDLWIPDEPRYAEVAREMINRGDWVLMHSNGKTYVDTPPLFFWLIAFSTFLWQGFSSFSVRFPAAFFGMLTILLTFLLGKALYSSRTGFLSGLILATSFEFSYLSTRANMDTTLTFFTTASLLCFFLWHRYSKEGSLSQKRLKDLTIYGFYAGMGLATLVKGPLGFILPLFISLIYLVIHKDWEGMKRMKLLTGMGLFLVIILSWYLPAVVKGGEDYLHATLFRQTVARFSDGWSKLRPIYYYPYNFPIDFLPWVFFIPAAVAHGFSRERREKRGEFLFLFIWFALIFIFFPLSRGKRAIHLLPLYPAAALMVGKLWNDFFSTPMDHIRNAWISVPLYGLMGVALVAGAALPWMLSIKFPLYLPYGLPITFLLVGGSLVMFVLYRFKNYGAILFVLVGIVAGGHFYTLRVIFPVANPYRSARFISQEIATRIQPGEKVAVYGGISPGPFNYYTGIVPILDLAEMKDVLSLLESSERIYCLLDYKGFSEFRKMEGRPNVQFISRRRVGDDEIVLVSNR